jgi:hypothetical protein
MNNPLILFGLAFLNVLAFECLFGLFHKILPDGKGEWCGFYWIGTIILAWSTHVLGSTPQQLAIWSPTLFVALIHSCTSFSTGPMHFPEDTPSDDKPRDNSSSFSNRIKTTKDAKKEGK